MLLVGIVARCCRGPASVELMITKRGQDERFASDCCKEGGAGSSPARLQFLFMRHKG